MAKFRPESISFDDLRSRIDSAVAVALETNPSFAGTFDRPQFFPDFGLVGYLVENDAWSELSMSDAARFTGALTPDLTAIGRPATLVIEGGVLVGFFPVQRSIIG